MTDAMRSWGLAGLLALAIPAAAPALTPTSEATLEAYRQSARIAAQAIPRYHLNHYDWDDAIATNALTIFLSALDYDRTFFLASDIAEFQTEATRLDDQLKDGNLQFAFKVYDRLMDRVSNRVAYVDTLLKQGFDLQQKENYLYQRKNTPWPADDREWNEIWRQKVKNQYVAKVVADQLAAEAATNAPAAAAATNLAAAGVSTNAEPHLTPEEAIRKDYTQYADVLRDNDAHWLLTLFVNSFAHAYDPHSDFMSAQNTEDFDINMKLSLVGIGALLSIEDGAARIERLIPGGPAVRDGRLKPGDKIVAVAQGDGEPVSILHWPLSRSVRLIRGEKGTRVGLTVIPKSDPSGGTLERVDLVRDEVKLEDQAAKGLVRKVKDDAGRERTVGIIRVPDFYADVQGRNDGRKEARSVTRDVRAILADFRTNGVEGVILDLRNNGGGLLQEAQEMTGLFIRQGPVVQVQTERGRQILRDPDYRIVYDGPLIVLVNRQSASASEILAGALQDYGRALIIGDSKTHGKGTVQSMIAVDSRRPALGTLKLTTATFHRVDGASTQREGVKADLVIPSILDYMEVGEEYLPHALLWSAISPTYHEKATNLAAMLPVLKERSQHRQAQNPQFTAYTELLKYLGEKREEKTIALDLPSRMRLARQEKEMADYMKSVDFSNTEEDPLPETPANENQPDLILRETTSILTDLIGLEETPCRVAASP